MVTIKRETIKRKRFIVARDKKGRFLTFKRETKAFRLNDAKRIFKQNNTFDKDLKKVSLTNVNEFTRTKEPARVITQKPPKGLSVNTSQSQRAQYVVTFILPSGKSISARSNQFDTPIPVEEAREQALRRALGRLSYEVLGESDRDEAEKLFETSKIRIREGVVYYRAKAR